MVRRYTFGAISLNYNVIGKRHRFLTSDELGPLVPLNQIITCTVHGRHFVGQGLTEDLPAVFELVPCDEAKLEKIRACSGSLSLGWQA
jgi:hypothetical protein